ncbi:hypothetical protein ACQPT6_16670, partial [Erwinia amylovora]|uniref:hypothetical protein n=1 Tax=Erwinia amylovora TaxID=552 RepID=UPI003D02BAB5
LAGVSDALRGEVHYGYDAEGRLLAAPGVAERPPQHAVFRPGYLAVTESALLSVVLSENSVRLNNRH